MKFKEAKIFSDDSVIKKIEKFYEGVINPPKNLDDIELYDLIADIMSSGYDDELGMEVASLAAAIKKKEEE